MRIFKYISIFFLIVAGIFYLLRTPNPYQVMVGQTMGTYYSIKVKTGDENKLLHKNIKEELEKINQHMSVFDNNSEISLINREAADKWIPLSEEMQKVLKNAYQTYRKSNGAFDPTIGKLIDLWGFGTIRPKRYPSEEDIAAVMAVSGFDKIIFSPDFTKLKKKNDDVTLNLSAIAKGYGVDRIADLLKQMGYNDFVVEIGGEVSASGQKSDKINGWKVGIVKPVDNYTENAHVVTLKDSSIATSGDYRNFVYIDDKKFSHTISPKTGYPAENNLISVTIFHKQCMEADALTTAMMAMGEKKAIDFANRYNLATILFVRNDDDTISEIVSEKAKKILGIK